MELASGRQNYERMNALIKLTIEKLIDHNGEYELLGYAYA